MIDWLLIDQHIKLGHIATAKPREMLETRKGSKREETIGKGQRQLKQRKLKKRRSSCSLSGI